MDIDQLYTIELEESLPLGTDSQFEFPIKGTCPEGGIFTGTCIVFYYPRGRLVNVASFQRRYSKSEGIYAEVHAQEIYCILKKMLGAGHRVIVDYKIEEAVNHGPLRITLRG